MTPDELKRLARQNLANAVENGYEYALKNARPRAVALDLCDFAADMAGLSEDAMTLLEVVIREWQTERVQYLCDDRRHLICFPYSEHFMHQMAAELGVGRHWFHAGRAPHYDVPKKRLEQIKAKCVVVRTRLIVKVIKGAQL